MLFDVRVVDQATDKLDRGFSMISRICCLLLIIGIWFTGSQAHAQVAPAPQKVIVSGSVRSMESSEPISHVTVRVLGTGRSTLTNADGEYRLVLEPGLWRLKFTHVAHYTVESDVNLGSRDSTLDVIMKSSVIELPGIDVYSRAYDPAQKIILEAIRRKQDILERIHDYRYDAYIKFVLRDLARSPDSAESIFLLTETQTTAYWEQPDKYKEVITARKQSSNIDPENNLVTVGEILNFNKNRIEIDKYSVVSPTAEDALDFYNYYLLDTVYLDSQPVYRLEIEPKSEADPLFVGTIDVADSTYDVVRVDVGLNEAARFEFVSDTRYSQRFALFENEYWMPIEIQFSAEIHFGVKLPVIPKDLSFTHTASLYDYAFDEGHPSGTFDEYLIVVEEEADEIDSAAWAARQTIPLTDDEEAAYVRIDSVEQTPKPIGTRLLQGLGIATALLVFGDEDIVHYNRVEGAYLGLGIKPHFLNHDLRLDLRTGYGFKREKAQHHYGAWYRLSDRHKLWVGAYWKDEVQKRSTVVADDDHNPTFGAYFFRLDPFDYYREKGFSLLTNLKLLNQTRLRLEYRDFEQHSLPRVTDHAVFPSDSYGGRENPAIADGHLRSVYGALTYDSRPLIRRKGLDVRIGASEMTMAVLFAETASPDLIDNDFDFTRYGLWAMRRQRTLGLGVTTISGMVGASTGDLPPQRYFSVDHGESIYNAFHQPRGVGTLVRKNFYGDRAALVAVVHDFDQQLWRKSRIPVIEDIPLTLSIHGAAFWSEFRNGSPTLDAQYLPTAPTAYTEVGLGLGNLTPMITPFNFAVYFTWQLSDYDTERFTWELGIRF